MFSVQDLVSIQWPASIACARHRVGRCSRSLCAGQRVAMTSCERGCARSMRKRRRIGQRHSASQPKDTKSIPSERVDLGFETCQETAKSFEVSASISSASSLIRLAVSALAEMLSSHMALKHLTEVKQLNCEMRQKCDLVILRVCGICLKILEPKGSVLVSGSRQSVEKSELCALLWFLEFTLSQQAEKQVISP